MNDDQASRRSSHVLVGQIQGQQEHARENGSAEDGAPWQRWSRAASSGAGWWTWVSHHPVVILQEWTLGVNLWGVIHGIRTFVPLMLEQQAEGHIVNPASTAGLISGPGLGIYKVTRHGIVTLSETLYHELALRGATIKVSVLCPGFVSTQVMDSARNRPVSLQNDSTEERMSPESEAMVQFMRQGVRTRTMRYHFIT